MTGRRTVIGLCLVALVLLASSANAGDAAAKAGITRGICVVLGDTEAKLALDLARSTKAIVYVQLRKDADVLAARGAVDAAGLYGTRVYVEKGDLKRIHLADNAADAVIALDPAKGVAEAEVLRVLNPHGKAVVGGKTLTKPFPAGVDDWSHHYHGPDNNSLSRDRVARAPYMTQFVVEPRYGPAPQASVAAAGRIFIAFGHVAWHRREEPALNTLFAINGYNGTVLWKRPLKSGIMVDRCTMIATADTLYVADDASCKLIDTATGKTKGEIAVPAKLTGGTFWKWMALDGGILYALIGEGEPMDPVAKWRRRGHGWPWGGISKGYNTRSYPWGFAKTLVAIDPKTKKVLWQHREELIDSRGLCVKDGAVYLCRFGQYLARLDAKTGRPVWRRTIAKDKALFDAIGSYRNTHGYIQGWKSTVYLKCSSDTLYFLGPQVNWLSAISAKDGAFKWKYPHRDLHVVIRDDGVYAIGPQRSRNVTAKLAPATGKVLARYPISRRACTRSTGTVDSILFRAHGDGTTRLDLATGKPNWISPMRPSCQVGVIISSGHLYWVPWACDCNLQMFGVIACAPAGNFKPDQKAVEAERLETFAGAHKVAALAVAPNDWTAYRGDNDRTGRTKAAVAAKPVRLWEYKPSAKVAATAPVAAGGLVFIGGSDGVVRALDAATGAERWKAYTGGQVRYPPAIAGGRAFVGSGDGWAYAFEAATGRLLWRFRAAPAERKINIYGSLISTWPVGAGVLVEKGTVYFAAGMNNYDGTHVYALDAATGKLRWQNNRSARQGPMGAGVGVQGDLLLRGGTLFLAGGSSVSPAGFDVRNGRLLGQQGRRLRGRELQLQGNGVAVYGQPFYSIPTSPVYDRSVGWRPDVVAAANVRLSCQKPQGPNAKWQLVARTPQQKAPVWQQPLPVKPARWGIAVDARGRAVVALTDGRVLCFGAKP